MTKSCPPPVDRWASAEPRVLRLAILAVTTVEALIFVYICAHLWISDGNLKLMVPAAFVAMTLAALVMASKSMASKSMASKSWHLRMAAALAMMSAGRTGTC